jgi:phosphoglucosamine mutase
MMVNGESRNRRLFGTDGIRGTANVHPMTVDTAMCLGKAVAYVFQRKNGRHRRILIGKDTRISCYMFENAMAAGICSMGVDVLLVGPMPTPAIAFLTAGMRAEAGVVISASHNPFYDNGIKLFSGDGFKLPDEIEMRIEGLMSANSYEQPTGRDIGKAFRIEDAPGRYIVFLKNTFPRHLTLDGLRIVLDCANGATYRVAPTVFEELGAEVIRTGVEPNGLNINDGCGCLFPQHLRELVLSHQAHLGIAFDGDGDRVIFVDEKGNILNGDHVLAICAHYLKGVGRLKSNTVVATVMSNMGLEVALNAIGCRLLRTQVGDRYVVEAMRQGEYSLGGEQSGHLIFFDYNTTGDGILAALQLLAVMQERGMPLSELAGVLTVFPQILQNVRIKERVEVSAISGLKELERNLTKDLNGRGRILIRASGTEPLIRIMVEGEDDNKIKMIAAALCEHVERNCS